MPRTDLDRLFGRDPGRTYPHYQRALEATFGLPAYSLEPLIEDWKNTCREQDTTPAR